MTREAKVYYLRNKDWTPIKEAVETDLDKYHLLSSIAIYKKNNNRETYVIISIENRIDEIIEANDGELAKKDDLFPKSIKRGMDYLGIQVFGERDLSAFIN